MMNNKYYQGILYAFVALFVIEINDCVIKLCLDIVDKSYIFFYKQYYVLLWYFLWCLVTKQKIIPKIKNKKIMLFRCLASVTMTASFTTGLSMSSIGIIQASSMLHPVFVITLGYYFMQEKIRLFEIFAIVIAIIGIYLLIKTNLQLNIGTVYGLISAFCMAIYIILTKKLKLTGESDQANIFCFSLSFCIFGFFYALFTGNLANVLIFQPKIHSYFLLTGLLYIIYLYLELQALSIIKSMTYSIIEYSNLIWALLFDYIFWSAVLTQQEALGVILIVLAKIIIIYYGNKYTKLGIADDKA